MTRDPQAQEQIAAARGPVASPALDEQIEAAIDAIDAASNPPMTPQVVLRGDDHAVFAAFADVCARLEANQRAGADLMREYQVALPKVSAMASRHGGVSDTAVRDSGGDR